MTWTKRLEAAPEGFAWWARGNIGRGELRRFRLASEADPEEGIVGEFTWAPAWHGGDKIRFSHPSSLVGQRCPGIIQFAMVMIHNYWGFDTPFSRPGSAR